MERHDADTDEKQRRAADAIADRWSVATARIRDIGTVLRHCASALDGVAPDIFQPQRVAAIRKAIAGTMRSAQPNKARRAFFAESTAPSHAIPLPPARLGPSDDHFVPEPPPTACPSEWRAWARSVRDLRPAWAAAQTEASTDLRGAGDSRDAPANVDTAIIAAARLRDLDVVLRLCASAIRGVPPAIPTQRDVAAVHDAIVGTSSARRRQQARSDAPAMAMPLPPAHRAPSEADSDPALRAHASAEEWPDWANYAHALRPIWIGIRLQATTRVDTERADDRASKLTAMYFDDHTSAHAMMYDKTCTTSPSLRAVPLHAHYTTLFRGSVFTEHDAARHVTRGAFTDYDGFLSRLPLQTSTRADGGTLIGCLRSVRTRRIGALRSVAMGGNDHLVCTVAGTTSSSITRSAPGYASAPS